MLVLAIVFRVPRGKHFLPVHQVQVFSAVFNDKLLNVYDGFGQVRQIKIHRHPQEGGTQIPAVCVPRVASN